MYHSSQVLFGNYGNEIVENDKMGQAAEKIEFYTYADYLTWPEELRYELIHGQAYCMTAPSTLHQKISMELCIQLGQHFRNTDCQVFAAPFDVKLPEKNEEKSQVSNVVQPDISVICDKNKIDEKGCQGAPDWIIEILSPSTAAKDYIQKLALYERHGVKSYWLVHPMDKLITIYQQTASDNYGKPKIVEAKGTLNVDLFPELTLNWQFIFPENA